MGGLGERPPTSNQEFQALVSSIEPLFTSIFPSVNCHSLVPESSEMWRMVGIVNLRDSGAVVDSGSQEGLDLVTACSCLLQPVPGSWFGGSALPRPQKSIPCHPQIQTKMVPL